jgi:hypothetical protein
MIRPAYQVLAVDNPFGGFVNDYSEPLALPSVLWPSRVDRFDAVHLAAGPRRDGRLSRPEFR